MASRSGSKVYFFSEAVRIGLKKRTVLKKFLETIFSNEGKKLKSLICVFCNDKKLRKINKEFLGHNTLTDIITFNLSESNSIQGELYISTERIRDNARLLNEKIGNEFLRVIIHGVLHLCDYDDKSVKNKKIMREKEDYYINLYKKKDFFT